MSRNNEGYQNPFAYTVDTTYPDFTLEDNPEDDVVPAIVPSVPAVQPSPSPSATPSAASASVAPPASTILTFTESGLENQPLKGKIQQGGSGGPNRSSGFPAPESAEHGSASVRSPTPPPEEEDPTKYPLYNVRRYRTYFNVDTKDVLWRMWNSFFGPFKADFLETTWDTPDLYGPFWVATTLVFVTAVAGNYNNYIQYVKKKDPSAASSMANNQWYNDTSKMSYSALMFYGYIFCLGLALFFALRWFKADIKLANIWCIYGYSLSVFIPVSFVCLLPLNSVRWIAVALATLSSGLFIVLNFRATIYAHAPARAMMMLAVMTACHLALGLAMKLYFFHYAVPSSTALSPSPVPSPVPSPKAHGKGL